MKKLTAILLSLLVISSHSYAIDQSKIEIRASSNDEQTTLMDTGLVVKVFQSSVMQKSTLSADANTVTALTIPTGAKAVFLDVGTHEGLHLVGAAGDVGISLDDTVPVLLPLSADGNTTISISNDLSTTATIKAYFF